jgi:hypothetical protein
MNDRDGGQHILGAGTRVGSTSDFITLLDGNEPVPDPEVDKFNLANRISNKEVNVAETTRGMETSSQTEEQQDWKFVRVKYESF